MRLGLLRLAACLAATALASGEPGSCDAPDTAALPPLVSADIVREAYERLQALGRARACPQPPPAPSHATTQLSDSSERLQRTFLSPAHRSAALLVASWFQDAGLQTWTDVAGNVRGRVDCLGDCARCGGALVFGSHYDTVLDAGKYDGPLGIVAAAAAVKSHLLRLQGAAPECPVRESSPHMRSFVAHAFQLEIVAFSDEEGVRFRSTFLGSRAFAGTLPPSALQAADGEGVTLEQALLEKSGLDAAGLQLALQAAAAPAGGVRAYVEVHIEQGPVLEGLGLPLGVVTAIAGQTFLSMHISGEQGHAGTVPMHLRRDPLTAAAEIVLAVEQRCQPGEGKDSGEGLVCTVGQLGVWPGASNVIAGQVNVSVDIRSRRDSLRSAVVDDVKRIVGEICERRGLRCSAKTMHEAPALECSHSLRPSLERAVSHVNALSGGAATGDPPLLVSGAGHDGMALSGLCEVGMLFVRCRGGVSHSPLEHVEPEDVGAAITALAHLLRGGLPAV